MKLAKVVGVHPERHKVDLLFLDDNRRVPGVRVMSPQASSSSGLAALVKPDAQDMTDPYEAPSKSGRDLIACVGFYGDVPVVHGFLFPEVAECLFADIDRYLHRTASDLYWTVDGQANAEVFHPSGAFLRMGTSSAHEDLKGKDVDGIFNPKRNAGNQVHIHVELAGGKGSIDMAPNGDVAITSQGKLTLHSDGDMELSSGSKIGLSAPRIDLN